MTSVAGWDRARTGRMVAIGVIGASVTTGLAACSGGSSNPSSTPATTAPPSAAAPGRAGHGRGLIGTITAENGSTWTVNARNGTAYIVSLTPQTQFGTRNTPGTAQQFPVGSTVRISGATNGNTITANRITAARPRNSTSTSPTSPPSGVVALTEGGAGSAVLAALVRWRGRVRRRPR
jgi:hypothetical protein